MLVESAIDYKTISDTEVHVPNNEYIGARVWGYVNVGYETNGGDAEKVIMKGTKNDMIRLKKVLSDNGYNES